MRAIFLACFICFIAGFAYGQAFSQSASLPKEKLNNRAELAPDQINRDLPINHAKLNWFVSVRELNRAGDLPIEKENLGKIIDQDISTAATFSKPRKYEIIFDLQRTVLVNRLSVVADAPGYPVSVRISDSDLSRNDGKSWREVGNSSLRVPVTAFEMRPQSVRFVYLTIDAAKMAANSPLHVYQFNVFGQEDVRDYTLRQTPATELKARGQFVLSNVGSYSKEMLQYDLANVSAGTKASCLSSTAESKNVSYMTDDDPATAWTADRKEKETFILLDFGAERRIKKISVMHSSRPGKILAYAFSNFPSGQSKLPQIAWLIRGVTDVPLFRLAQNIPPSPSRAGPLTGGQPAITSQWLDTQTPFGAFNSEGSNFSTVTGDVQTGRYLLLRYFNPTPGGGLPLMVNAINVVGDYSPEYFVLMPRSLPIIAAGGPPAAPDSGPVGLPIVDQLKEFQVPSPPLASP